MFCTSCGCTRSDNSGACAQCGARPYVVAPPPSSGVMDRALAEANLLRVRHQFIEAERRCVDVIRKEPRNIHAHSLLGDICRDQGQQDEARRWYQLALDLQPGRSDSAARVAPKPVEQRGTIEEGIVSPTIRTDDIESDGLGTSNLYGISPKNWMRGIWLMSTAFIVFVILIVIYRQNSVPHLQALPHPDETHTKPTSTIALGSNVNNPKAPVEINHPEIRPGTGSGAPSISVAPRIPGEAGLNPGASSESEIALLNSLLKNVILAPGGDIAGVEISNSDSRVKLKLLRRWAPDIQASQLRLTILRDAYNSARGTFLLQEKLQTAVVDVSLTDGSGAAQLAFHGELERAMAAQPLPDDTTEALNRVFGNTRWIDSLVTHELGSNGNVQ